jgi:hypothetical protein
MLQNLGKGGNGESDRRFSSSTDSPWECLSQRHGLIPSQQNAALAQEIS